MYYIFQEGALTLRKNELPALLRTTRLEKDCIYGVTTNYFVVLPSYKPCRVESFCLYLTTAVIVDNYCHFNLALTVQ